MEQGMIFDRTSEDVELAKSILDNKIKKGQTITEDEKKTLEKGTLTISTLNRIESMQGKLKTELAKIGYYNTSITNRSWKYEDIFKKDDLERIVKNTVVLRDAFFVFFETPSNPTSKYYFEDFNRMEKILQDLEDMEKNVIEKYMLCGTFNCGEENLS